MNSLRYAILSLLTREPLTGYDIKMQMNNRLSPYSKVGSNQVYPELSKMENDGLIQLLAVEPHSYRPTRKVFTITEKGREAIVQWTTEPGGVNSNRDDFIQKIYNSWLVDPEKMKQQIWEVKKHHEEKLAGYLDKITELTQLLETHDEHKPIDSSISVVEFGVRYERVYMEWCDYLINKL